MTARLMTTDAAVLVPVLVCCQPLLWLVRKATAWHPQRVVTARLMTADAAVLVPVPVCCQPLLWLVRKATAWYPQRVVTAWRCARGRHPPFGGTAVWI